jgi:hypothetical protein
MQMLEIIVSSKPEGNNFYYLKGLLVGGRLVGRWGVMGWGGVGGGDASPRVSIKNNINSIRLLRSGAVGCI